MAHGMLSFCFSSVLTGFQSMRNVGKKLISRQYAAVRGRERRELTKFRLTKHVVARGKAKVKRVCCRTWDRQDHLRCMLVVLRSWKERDGLRLQHLRVSIRVKIDTTCSQKQKLVFTILISRYSSSITF